MVIEKPQTVGGLAETTGPGIESGKKRKKATVNARMIDALNAKPEAVGWTTKQWAKHLKCSESAIVGTRTWKTMKEERDQERAKKRNDRRQRPRHYGNDNKD